MKTVGETCSLCGGVKVSLDSILLSLCDLRLIPSERGDHYGGRYIGPNGKRWQVRHLEEKVSQVRRLEDGQIYLLRLFDKQKVWACCGL
ncbi:MAG: hypothetical protein ACI8V2_004563 [Candidatus Latescibacterota bacterium]